jgi:putative endonuclease
MDDPDQVLAQLRDQCLRILHQPLSGRQVRNAACELASRAHALDQWLTRGGILPRAWQLDDGPPPWELPPFLVCPVHGPSRTCGAGLRHFRRRNVKTTSAENRAAAMKAAIVRAEQYLQDTGLRALDRDWHYADGRLDVIASDGQHVLVVCMVRVTRRGARQRPVDAVRRSTIRSKRRLAVIWMREHGVRYDEIRVDVFGLIYEGTGGYTTEHIKAVG